MENDVHFAGSLIHSIVDQYNISYTWNRDCVNEERILCSA